MRLANEALERDIATGKMKCAEICHDDMEKEEWQGQYIEMVRLLSRYVDVVIMSNFVR
jgi:hypothetical protein